jgi:hypothetical protein
MSVELALDYEGECAFQPVVTIKPVSLIEYDALLESSEAA